MRKTKNDTRIYPIPEIIERGWEIRDAVNGGIIDYTGKIIAAPLADTPIKHNMRVRQIASIKYDDCSVALPDYVLHHAVEAYRLSYLLDRCSIEFKEGFTDSNLFASLRNQEGRLAEMLFAEFTDRAEQIASAVPDDYFTGIMSEVRKRIKDSPTKNNSVAIADWLYKQLCIPESARTKMSLLIQHRPPNAGPSHFGYFGYCGFGYFGLRRGKSSITPEEHFEQVFSQLPSDSKINDLPSDVRKNLQEFDAIKAAIDERKNDGHEAFNEWGRMSIHEPPRCQRLPQKLCRTWRVADEGTHPRYPHRFAVDRRVFARRIKIPGGVVVIDHSGSMSLQPEHVEQILMAAPGCTVASYSGNYDTGTLRILAKKGKYVGRNFCERPDEPSNVIDFHALMWAYKQSCPRLWVSDMCVSGIGDSGGASNLAQCLAIVKKGRFFVANNVTIAIAELNRLRKFYGRIGK